MALGYVLASVGAMREVRRTDFAAAGFDPDAVHDGWVDLESLIPADWEGEARG